MERGAPFETVGTAYAINKIHLTMGIRVGMHALFTTEAVLSRIKKLRYKSKTDKVNFCCPSKIFLQIIAR